MITAVTQEPRTFLNLFKQPTPAWPYWVDVGNSMAGAVTLAGSMLPEL